MVAVQVLQMLHMMMMMMMTEWNAIRSIGINDVQYIINRNRLGYAILAIKRE